MPTWLAPVKKTRSEALWQRFRGACDQFFMRYAQRHDIARVERIAAREAICAELEALAGPAVVSRQASVGSLESSVASLESSVGSPESSVANPQSPVPGPESPVPSPQSPIDPPADLMATVRSLRGRWQSELAARGVDRERAAALDERFAAAFNAVIVRWPAVFGGSDLDPDANRKRMEALVRRMEDLAKSVAGPVGSAADAALSPTTRLAAMLKEALAANTIGGKVDDDSRFRAANDEVRQAQAGWSRIGPVPEEARRPLADRFQRAIRRITDATGQAGTAGVARTGR